MTCQFVASECDWVNKNNLEFYEVLSADHMLEIAGKIGLHSAPDIREISSYVASSSSMLEVGVGYGRVIEHVLSINKNIKFCGVDNQPSYISGLSSSYPKCLQFLFCF